MSKLLKVSNPENLTLTFLSTAHMVDLSIAVGPAFPSEACGGFIFCDVNLEARGKGLQVKKIRYDSTNCKSDCIAV